MVSKAKTFEFSAYRFDKEKGQLVFTYLTILNNSSRLRFSEKIILPKNLKLPTDIPTQLLTTLLQSLHLILGVNYWKLFCPAKIVIKPFSLTEDQARFWNTVYTQGLGEFFYRNKIKNFRRLIDFPFQKNREAKAVNFARQNRSLVAIGGGKDSIVSLELLKMQPFDFSGFVVETNRSYPVVNQVIDKAKIDAIKIRRLVDEKLFNIGKSYRIFQGHYPISAIYAFLSILVALFYDFRYIIVANERSSDEANVKYDGELVNHQWSKTSEFEMLFRDYIKTYLTSDVSYFSLLRPWYELRIAKEFANYKKYWTLFSSCNRNFSLTKPPPKNRWCGECAKCASIFLLLSPFIKRAELVKIFAQDLFAKRDLIPIYKQLLDLAGVKPFECVATTEESRLALYLTFRKKEYRDTALIKLFENKILRVLKNIPTLEKKYLGTADMRSVPDLFKPLLVKKVLILGYGKEGSASEKYLKIKYPHLVLAIADKTLSDNYLRAQRNFDLAIKTPGIPRQKVTIPYITATNVFFSSIDSLAIGVTGSKGKSTTASLIYHILKTAGRDVHLVGNIGKPALESLFKPVSKDAIFVIELSSYQLADVKSSPQIAVITNLFPEHMDYHGGVTNYYSAKKNIFRFQSPSDYLVYNRQNSTLKKWSKEAVGKVLSFERLIKIDPKDIPLLGKHNLDNLRAAITVTHLLKISDQAIRQAVKTFKPLPHRLEFVGQFKGIKFYDDAISTAPESTIAAIEALPNTKTIFLGGEDRGFDFRFLVKVLAQAKISNIVLFPETGARIYDLIRKEKKYQARILKTNSMAEAVKFAYKYTPKNSVCLLSTASPSYSLWKNFEEKGDQFKQFVKDYSTS